MCVECVCLRVFVCVLLQVIDYRSSCEHCTELQAKVDQLEKELTHRQQELSDKDKLNDFLQEQIR